MVKIRNPWGKNGWKGPWHNEGEEWTIYPFVKKQLRSETADADAGIFWMQWKDFTEFWTQIGVLDMNYDIMSLHTPLYNEKELTGPVKGCLKGSFKYWCCAGPRHLLVARRAAEDSMSLLEERRCCGVDPAGCYCRCFKTTRKERISYIGHKPICSSFLYRHLWVRLQLDRTAFVRIFTHDNLSGSRCM